MTKQALFNHITGVQRLKNLINDRFFPGIAPSGAQFPHVVYNRIFIEHEHHLLGSAGLKRERFQLDVVDFSSPGAEAVAEQLRLALDGFRGFMGEANMRSIFLMEEREDIEPPSADDEQPIFRIIQEYAVASFEAEPALT